MTGMLEAVPARLAPALLDPGHSTPTGLRTWNESDPARRLAVHRNNVLSSLIDALADTFPVALQLVGEEFFRAMGAAFVRAAPPRMPVLAQYGGEFPGFVAAFPPAIQVPYLADVARLEWLRVLAYHSADADPVGPEALQALSGSGASLDEIYLSLHPSVQVFCAPFAAVSIWAAHQGQLRLEDIDVNVGEDAVVLRQALDVLVLPTDSASTQFVQAVAAASSIAVALEAAKTEATDFNLVAFLATLFSRGAVTALELR